MLDWLKRPPRQEPVLMLEGREVPVVIRRLAHARRMTLRLAPDGSEVRVSIPRSGRTAEALAFARAQQDWLARQLEAVPPPQTPGDGGSLPFRGVQYAVAHDSRGPRRVRVEDGAIHLGGPEEGLAARLRRWLQAEARALVEADLGEYCQRLGRPTPKLALSNARRRWGSCAANGTIRINWRLVMAPDFVRRSVVAHEVAHLVHFDHSPRFHRVLGELYEADMAQANRWLKREGRTLYVHFG